MKKIGMLIASLLLFALFINACRKKGGLEESENIQATTLSNVASRFNTIFSGVSYNSSLNVLEFSSVQAYQTVVTTLTSELDNALPDNGRTSFLLSEITNNLNSEDLRDTLLDNSPLSDTVISALLSRNYPEQLFLEVMNKNWALSDNSLAKIFDSKYSPTIIEGRVNAIKTRPPYHPILSDFEDAYPGFLSYRKNISQLEITYLSTGADPAGSANPSAGCQLGLIDGTLYNDNLEIVIGSDYFRMLPTYNVKVNKNNTSVIQYIRQYNKIPVGAVPANEPTNGFIKSSVAAPVSSEIEILATAPNDLSDDQVIIQAEKVANTSQSFAFSSNITDQSYTYYWDFGDGKVSFQKNPIHTFSGSYDGMRVELRVIRPDGLYGIGVLGPDIPDPQNGTTDCKVTHFTSAHNFSGMVGTLWIHLTDNSNTYNGNFPIKIDIDWGDGSAIQTENVTSLISFSKTHTYPNFGMFDVKTTVTAQFGATSFDCPTEAKSRMHIKNPQPPCCDRWDKTKEWWYSNSTNTRKYKHMFKVRNTVFIWGELDSEIHLFKVFTYGQGGEFWVPANETSCLSWQGATSNILAVYFSPCNNSKKDAACNSDVHNPFPASRCRGFWYTLNLATRDWGCYIWLGSSSTVSKASAWNVDHLIGLTDDCD